MVDTLDTLPAVSDPDRLRELHATEMLDSPAEEAFDRITRLAQRLLVVRASAISLVDADRQFFKSAIGLDAEDAAARETPLSSSFCQFAVTTAELLVIDDTHRSHLVRHNSAVVQGGVRTYAGVPLQTPSGQILGTLCVFDTEPRVWINDEIDLLTELTQLANSEIAYRLKLRRLTEVEQGSTLLAEAVEALGDTLAPFLHELSRERTEPRVERIAALTSTRLETAVSAAQAVKTALAEQARTADPCFITVDLRDRVTRATRVAAAMIGADDIDLRLGERAVHLRCDPYEIERALTQLLISALQHADEAAQVEVKLDAAERRACLEVWSPGRSTPASQLARVVSRFHAATCGDPTTGGCPSISMQGGHVVAQNGPITATASNDGTRYEVTFTTVESTDQPVVDVDLTILEPVATAS